MKIKVVELKPGMILAADVVNKKGDVLYTRGKTLNHDDIKQMSAMKLKEVLVKVKSSPAENDDDEPTVVLHAEDE